MERILYCLILIFKCLRTISIYSLDAVSLHQRYSTLFIDRVIDRVVVQLTIVYRLVSAYDSVSTLTTLNKT